MKTFTYTARTEAGAKIDGVIEANTTAEAIDRLKRDGQIVGSIEESGSSYDIELHAGSKKVKEKSLAIMCNQMAIIMQAGIPIVHALQLVSDQTDDKGLKAILKDVADNVSAGYGLANGFQKHEESLPETFIETVRAGESSGKLDVVFRRMSEYYEHVSKSKSKAQSALVYPLFVLGVAVIVIAIIMLFAVPTFETTFVSMGVTLPWITQFMIASSDFWVSWWWLIAVVVIAAVIAVRVLKRSNEDFSLKWSSWALRVPVFGRINMMTAASQYAGTMSVMLEAGLSVADAVAVTARSLSNHFLAVALAGIKPDIESGKTFAGSLRKTKVFSELVCDMTAVGEQTGSLESTLKVLGEYYDNEIETATARALSIMEPVIIIFLAVIVLFILLAVYLPVFGLYGSIGG